MWSSTGSYSKLILNQRNPSSDKAMTRTSLAPAHILSTELLTLRGSLCSLRPTSGTRRPPELPRSHARCYLTSTGGARKNTYDSWTSHVSYGLQDTENLFSVAGVGKFRMPESRTAPTLIRNCTRGCKTGFSNKIPRDILNLAPQPRVGCTGSNRRVGDSRRSLIRWVCNTCCPALETVL